MIEAMRACDEGWDFIVACGGDGTVNEVAKGVAQSHRKIPVAILSAGTVNDLQIIWNYQEIWMIFFRHDKKIKRLKKSRFRQGK